MATGTESKYQDMILKAAEVQVGGVPVYPAGKPVRGTHRFVDTVTGSDAHDGLSWATAKATMDAAFDDLDSGDVVWFVGNVREELTTPAGIFDVTVIGAGNQPRHADAHTGNNGYRASTWKTPASPTAATPLLIVQQQGWKIINILFDGPSDAAAVQLFRDGGAGDAERDGSHAHIIGCKFVAGQNHIEFKGGLSQVVIENNLFFGATADSFLDTTGAGIGTNNYYRIVDNHFHNNESHIDAALNYATIKGNTFGKFTTDSLSLTGGSENIVWGNYFYGTYSNAGGYDAGTNDEWGGNFNSLSGGVTAADPA